MNAAVGALSAGAAGIAAQRHQRVRWYHATSALRVPFGAVQKTANLARQSANHPNCRWLQAPAQCSARSATRTGLLGAANPRVFYSLALLSLSSLSLSLLSSLRAVSPLAVLTACSSSRCRTPKWHTPSRSTSDASTVGRALASSRALCSCARSCARSSSILTRVVCCVHQTAQ